MFENCGKIVLSLRRIRIGVVEIDKNLAPGECREMTKEECEQLFLHDFC